MMRIALLLVAAATFIGSSPPTALQSTTEDLVNAPIVHTMNVLPNGLITATVVGESLLVTASWDHPADGLGIEDSTSFRIRATRTLRFTGGGTVAPDTWRRRKFTNATTADTFKLLKPNIGDSVIFRADSIRQCRQNACSVPGGAGWGYRRSAAPPAITFIKTTIDSF